MQVSAQGLALIKEAEGFRAYLYNDCANNCTIGYGTLVHLGPIYGEPREKIYECGISEAEAESLLLKHCVKTEQVIEQAVRVPLTQGQFDALVSFVYNVGEGAFLGSTLLKKLNARDYEGAAEQFKRWDHAGGEIRAGLTKRRLEEATLFAGDRHVPALSPA